MIKNALILSLLFSACATKPAAQPCQPGLTIVNAALWAQSSAEYQASAMQTYASARKALDMAMSDEATRAGSEKPPAVVLDLDETAIQNAAFESRMIAQGKTYDAAAWTQWVNESAATAMPGAAEFLAYAKSRGVTPFYVTNRKVEEQNGTLRNLEKLGYPLGSTEDTLLVRGERTEWSSGDKTARRDYVASRYRVLLVLGDDLNDFIDAQGKTVEQRNELIRTHAANWGTSWFILPNPIYGSWEATVMGKGNACEQMNRKLEALRQ